MSLKTMIKIAKHTIQSCLALLLLGVFAGALLGKPVHSLLAHHQHSERVCATSYGYAVIADHYKDCLVCEFEFCTFVPQKRISIPQQTLIVCKEQPQQVIACLAGNSTHLFQLRAPPAL